MDPILLLELTDNLNDAMAAMDAAVAADDSLAILDATDALNEALAAMDGESMPNQNDEPAAKPLLTGIISGAINTFQDKGKLQELSDALAKDGGDSIPAGELRDLYENAIRAAGVQVLKGYGYLDAAA